VRVDATQPSGSVSSPPDSSDVTCRQSTSGHVSSLIETLQPPPPSPLRSPSHRSGRSFIDALHAQTSAALGSAQPTLAGAVLRGVDLSLAAVVLGTSPNTSQSRATTGQRRPPEMRIHVTTESPERASTTSPSHGVRPASGIGRRSAGVPHGSVRAFQQQQQRRVQTSQHHNTLLVVPPSSSSRSASSSPLLVVSTRAGSVSTSPSSASPSPSPEPVSRDHGTASRSLSTSRPLGVTRPATDDRTKPSRTSRTDDLHEQETFV